MSAIRDRFESKPVHRKIGDERRGLSEFIADVRANGDICIVCVTIGCIAGCFVTVLLALAWSLAV